MSSLTRPAPRIPTKPTRANGSAEAIAVTSEYGRSEYGSLPETVDAAAQVDGGGDQDDSQNDGRGDRVAGEADRHPADYEQRRETVGGREPGQRLRAFARRPRREGGKRLADEQRSAEDQDQSHDGAGTPAS